MQKLFIAAGLVSIGVIVWLVDKNRTLLTGLGAETPASQVPPAALPEVATASPEPVSSSLTKQVSETPADLFAPWNRLPIQMKDPAFRAAKVKEARARLELEDGRLFQRMKNLTPAQLDAIKDILASMKVDSMVALTPRSSDESAEAVAHRLSQFTELDDMAEKQIAAAAGVDAGREYRAYRDSLAYRGTVEEIANGMRSRGLTIDDAEQEKILDAYTQALTEATRLNVSNNARRSHTATDAAARAQSLDTFDQQLAVNLSHILPPNKLSAFMDAQLAQENTP